MGKSLLRWAILLLLLVVQLRQTTGLGAVPLVTDCPAPQVLDTTGLACSECDSGLVRVETGVCGCPSTSLQTSVDCDIETLWRGSCVDVSCSSECSLPSEVVSLNNKDCIPCSNSARNDPSTTHCTCNNPAKGPSSGTPIVTKKLVEVYDDSGLPMHVDCATCPRGTAVIMEDLYEDGQQYFFAAGRRYSANPHVCASCPDPHMFFDTDYSCVCEDGYMLTGEASVGVQACIKNGPSVTGSYSKVRFQGLNIAENLSEPYDFSLESITFAHLYPKAAAECEYYRKGTSDTSLQSCQALGNLCVMSMYDEDAPACKQFEAISQRRTETYHGQEDWKNTLPWLFYRSDEAESIANDRGINMKVSFHPEDDRVNTLTFKLAKYAVNGTLVGVEGVESLTNQFGYCDNSAGSEARWLSFGYTYRREHMCSLEHLLEEHMFLYDLYLVDESSESCSGNSPQLECLYPIPVLNRNLAIDGKFPNVNRQLDDELDDVYTRRFFLFDNQSGRTTEGAEAIRYAKKVVLKVPTQSANPDQLYTPQLVVEYATATRGSWSDQSNGADASLVFKVEYSMQTDNFWESIQVMTGFLCAAGVVIFGIRMNNFQSRQRSDNDPSTSSILGLRLAIHALAVACHTFVLLFGSFLLAICGYWYLFFKLQNEVFIMLPSGNEFDGVTSEYLFFDISFRLLFWCQTTYVGYLIFRQCRSDIIFVDWEIPRIGKASDTGVPMWRLVMVANEFNRMQAKRRSCIEFSLIFVAFFMLGLDQHKNALPQPNLYQGQHGEENIALAFANGVFFWAFAWVLQWLWRVIIYERVINEQPATKFVDLCTVSNISVFIMIQSSKGWYLHGKTPYQTADCSIDDMLHNLRRESIGHFLDRGFHDATGSVQSFDFYASPTFRRQISKIYGYALPGEERPLSRLREDEAGSKEMDKTPLARAELTQFLQSFIDQQPLPSKDGLSYTVREPWMIERLFGVTPAEFRANDEPKCIFHPDNGGFLAATFLGIELDLLLHDILTYTVANLVFNNAGVSIFLCYAMHLLRTTLRSWLGTSNLSAKALVDAKFLGVST